MTTGIGQLTRAFTEGRLTRRQLMLRLAAAGVSLPAALAILEACSGGNSGGGGAGGTVSTKAKLVVGIIQEPTSLDPTAAATASISLLLLGNVYEGLVRLDPTGKVVPALAKSWEQSPDGKTYTFHLQSGVKWHDGGEFTAQDVKWSWDRAASSATTPANPHKDYFDPVQSVDVVDPHTVKVTLKAFSYNFLFHMTAGSACIVSQKTSSTNGVQPVGTGPFKFSSWNKQTSLSLTRNDSYWGDRAKLKDVEFRFISDANAMNNALRAGDIDVIQQVGGPEQAASLKADFAVLEGAPAGKLGVYINNARVKDANIRRAIYAAIDRKPWIDGIQAGYAVPIGSHAVPNDTEPYYQDQTAVNSHDLNRARQLLAQAGAGGLTLTLAQITDFPYAVRGTDILVSQLKDAGITVKVNGMQFNGWLKDVFTGKNYDLTIINHAEARDIANYANAAYYWGYSNPQVSDWLKQADAEPDDSKRKGLYGQIQKQLATDAVHAWIYSPKTLAIAKKNLKGFPAGSIAPGLYLAGCYFN